jgi:amidase
MANKPHSNATSPVAAGDICFASVRQLSAALAARQIGTLELLDTILARVEAHNPTVNAVVAVDIDAARAAARRADDALARGETVGPLHGLPMTIKDTFAVTGMPTTGGLPALAGYRAEKDADGVARLRAAGAIIFGKTNVPLLASDHQTYNDVYGLTRNPWNLDRTVGGSSGGSAAALAAGFTPLEFGSDIGGSIRVPAHCCGVFGHKSSFGIVSGRGHVPPMPGQLHRPELSVAGPMARSAYDLELALDLLVGPDEARSSAWAITLPAARHKTLADFRVGLWADGAYPLDSRYQAAIEAFADDLRRQGVSIDATARPPFDVGRSFETYLAVLMGIIGSRMPVADLDAIAMIAEGADPTSYQARIAAFLRQSVRQSAELAEERETLFVLWRDFFQSYDVLICPVLPTVAFPHDTEGHGIRPQFSRRICVDGKPRPYLDNLMWPGLATVANLPATAIPTGHFVDGLPVGIQVIGPYLEDRTPLRFAQLLEDRLPLFTPPHL